MSTLKERLEQALAARPDASKAALARACNISKASVSGWFSGATRSLDGQNLLAAAEYLGVRPEWLASGRGPMAGRPESGGSARGYTLEQAAVWDDDTPVDDDEVEVPFYKEVEFSAGSGIVHGLEINGRRVRYGRSSLRAAGVDPHNAACGKATGNSMEPLIQDGSLVGIDRGKTQILDGEIYALDQDGMLRVKFVYRLPGGGLRLRSFNQDEHPDETYSAEDARSIKILGWVWTWSPPIRKWRGR